jgi:hypothetical protein
VIASAPTASSAPAATPGRRLDASAARRAAAPVKVTVRIEGASRTLLPTTTVHVHIGRPVSSGSSRHACRSKSALGALQAATRGRWSGSWSAGARGYLVPTILGDTESGASSYWELFVDNVAATTGVCAVRLHSGERLLFAAVPTAATALPIAIKLLSQPVSRKPFLVQVLYYNVRGAAIPLAGASVTATTVNNRPRHHVVSRGETGASGTVELTVSRLGLIELGASKPGYVRAALVAAQVAGHAF